MWRNRRQSAFLVALVLSLTTSASAANKHRPRMHPQQPARVVSVTEDIAGNFVLLNLQKGQQLAVPVVHYLPGPDGQALMAADFNGVILSGTARTFLFHNAAVKRLTVGQFTSAPPTIRLTFLARSTGVFKAINFRASKGGLAIKLPPLTPVTTAYAQPHVVHAPVAHAAVSTTSGRAGVMSPGTVSVKHVPEPAPALVRADKLPPAAPQFVPAVRRDEQVAYLPPVAPPIGVAQNADPNKPMLRGPIILDQPEDATYTFIGEKQPARPPQSQKQVPAPVAAGASPHLADRKDSVRTGSPRSATSVVLKMDGTELRVRTAGDLPYKTFRLHDPERYVIDIPGLDSANLTAPAVPASCSFIKGIRCGSPEDSPSTARIVIDLSSDAVVVNEKEDPLTHELAVAFQPEPEQQPKPAATAPKRAPENCLIVLDPGHGGSDPGAQRGDIQEKEITLEIVEKLRRVLESKGVHVRLTRADDSFVSLEDRVKITNDLHPNAFLSVHINALETNTAATGIETYYHNDASKDFAGLIHEALVKQLSEPDRNVRKARFYVINHTPIPAVLAEVGFISNKDERDRLVSPDYQTHIAEALANGVMLYLQERSPGLQTASSSQSAAAAGTISTLAPSTRTQSFTQNLQTKLASETAPEQAESRTARGSSHKEPDEKRKTFLGRQSLKFKKSHLASTRS